MEALKPVTAFKGCNRFQSVKEGGFKQQLEPTYWDKKGGSGCKVRKSRHSPEVRSQLFEIHGSKLKRDPLRDASQASMVCITHGVFFFRIGKDTLNGLFAHGIYVFRHIGFAYLLRQIHGVLPDVPLHGLLPLGVRSALLPAGTASADFRGTAVYPFAVFVGCGMPENLSLRAEQPVVFFIIGKVPWHKAFPACAVGAGVRKNGNPAVF